MTFGLAPNGSPGETMMRWPTSSPATNASTSSPTTASTRSPAANADAGTQPAHRAPTRKRSPRRSTRPRRLRLTASTRALTVGRFLTEQWMPRRRSQLRATTAHRYEWMIDNYINPRIGNVPLRGLRVEHLDRLYYDLAHQRQPHRRWTRIQDRLRRPRHHSLIARRRHTTQPRHRQRRARRPRTARPTARTMRTGNVDRQPTPPVPDERCPPAALPRAAPRRHHRHAPR